MRKSLIAGVILTAVVVTGPGAAAAVPRPAEGPAQTTRVCKLKALESVKIRKSKNIRSKALGLFPKGAKAKSGCITRDGGEYSLCGRKGWPTWRWVEYKNVPRGWVPYACVEPI